MAVFVVVPGLNVPGNVMSPGFTLTKSDWKAYFLAKEKIHDIEAKDGDPQAIQEAEKAIEKIPRSKYTVNPQSQPIVPTAAEKESKSYRPAQPHENGLPGGGIWRLIAKTQEHLNSYMNCNSQNLI